MHAGLLSAIATRGRRGACLVLCLLGGESAGVARAQANTAPPLLLPAAIAYDAAGDLYIADARRHQVLEATLAGTLLVVAGTGVQGFAGDGGMATAAELNSPQGLAFGGDGTLYIADTGNARIRAVSAGIITTFAGTGSPAFGGDGGAASAASFRAPTALALDATGAMLVTDTADHRIRRISHGVVATFAGTGIQGFAGDGLAATQAELDSPAGIAVAADGRVFLADTHNNRVRVITSDGRISTFAGTGQRGFSGDGGPASTAMLAGPRGLAVTPSGALLLADAENQRIRSVSPAGVMTSVAGAGSEGTSADGAGAASAALHAPRAVAVSTAGMPAFADQLNGTVRVLIPTGTLFQPAALAPGRTSTVGATWASSQTYGQATGLMMVSGAVPPPQGTVVLSDGATSVGSATLTAGTATISAPALPAGIHTLSFTYGGDGLNPAAMLSLGAVSVTPAQVIATANSATVAYGVALPVFSGSLSGVLPQDTGQVTAVFSAGVGPLADVGTYPITATLSGPRSGNYTLATNSAPGSLRVIQAGSQTTLNAVSQGYVGVPVRLSANVAPATHGTPTGTIQFLDGGTVVGTGTLVNGSASAVDASPSAGSHTFTAQYGGDHNFGPSSTAPQVAVVSVLPDFSVSVAGASSATVPAGSVAAYGLTVSAQNPPFTGDVTLSASGLPAGATVVFSPVQVVPGTGSATVTVSVQTAAAQALVRHGREVGYPLWAMVGVLFCGGCLARRRGRLLLLFGMCVVFYGCGARTVNEAGDVPLTQSYNLQLAGTSTNLLGAVVVHTAAVTLIVQN